MRSRTLLLLSATLVAACAPGACQRRTVEVEVCARAPAEGDCAAPASGFAAGIGYHLRAAGDGLPGEVVLVLLELRDGEEPREAARAPVDVSPGASQLEWRFFFPTVGSYRIEVRAPDGAVLGRRDVDVTIPTSRPARRP